MVKARQLIIILLFIASYASYFLTPALKLSAQPTADSSEYGPYDCGKYYAVVFWIPCASAGSKGVATMMLYPKQPRYGSAAPVAVYVQGGPYPGFFPFLREDWDPFGVIWIYFIFPGGKTTLKLPNGQKMEFESGGTYDYRGSACYEALYAVLQFAQGKLASGSGKKIGDYVDYQVLIDNVGMYGSSYGGVMAAMIFYKYKSGLENVKYIVFYESPATNFLTTTDLGRIGEDKNWNVDADGDGLPWNDIRNLKYVPGSCTETNCTIDFSTLKYDADVGFYLDNNGNGKPDGYKEKTLFITDVNKNGKSDPDEDFVFRPWVVELSGKKREVYSYLVMKAAHEKGLTASLPSVVMSLEETYNFWYERDMGFHYDEIVANAPWIKVMQLSFLREHMCPAPDYPNIVVNYNAFKKRGIWIRLNPDKCYLDYVLGRSVDAPDNDANIEITFSNVRDHTIKDSRMNLNNNERKLIEQASVAEMADRVYYNNWKPNLNKVLAETKETPAGVKVLRGTWINIGPDGGDNYFVYVTSKHTVITATGNSAFISRDGGKTWRRITEVNLIDIGFVSMAEANGVLFAGVGRGRGLMMSTDDGETWVKINTGVEELEKGEYCSIVSIVALSDKRLFLGIRSHVPEAKSINWIYELVYTGGTWKAIKHELPPNTVPPKTGWIVYRLAYDPDFNGQSVLFVSKYPVGLYMVTNLDGKWKWTKILDKQTTAVAVAEEENIVYVGTYDDWIYRGEYSGGKWTWTRLNPLEGAKNPPKLERPPIICDIKVDPYNPNRIWWGSPGKLVGAYPYPENHRTVFGVAAWDPDNKKWLHSFVEDGWGAFIAVDKHSEGENPEDYKIYINGIPGAKIAYTCSYSFKSLLKTVDGGKTWTPSYNGLYGECMNQISFLSHSPHPHTFVALCQAGIEISYDYGETWVDDFDLPPGAIRAGFPWYMLPFPAEYSYSITVEGRSYTLDLLLLTAYPGPVPGVSGGTKEKRYGLIAISSQYIIENRHKTRNYEAGTVRLTTNPTVYGLIVDHYVVLALQEDGVEVYDLVSKTSFISRKGLPTKGGTCRIAYYRSGETTYWFVATYEGEPIYKTQGNDHYFWFGPSRIFMATNLLAERENTQWKQVYPSSGKTSKGIVSIEISSKGELFALEASGKLIYCPDVTSPTPVFKTLELSPAGSSPTLYTCLKIDWSKEVAYISSIEGEGVYYTWLEEIRKASNTVKIYPFNTGLSTRLIRHMAITPDGKYLFAGAWWSSSWRVEPKISVAPALGTLKITAPSEVSVGEEFTVKIVAQTTEGQPIPNLAVKLYVGSKLVGEKTTGSSGEVEFTLVLQTPGQIVVKAVSSIGEATATVTVVEALLRIETSIPNKPIVKINGKTYITDSQGAVEVKGKKTYTVEVVPLIPLGKGARIVFVKWSTGQKTPKITVAVEKKTVLVAEYKKQYFVKVESQYGSPTGEGWYDEGSTIQISVQPTVDISFLQQAVFVKWGGDIDSTSPTTTLVVDSPKHIVAEWRIEYKTTTIILIAAVAVIAIVALVAITLKKKTSSPPPPPPPPPR
ncbi:MAG: hypothetical protein DRJ52_02140 [Thermoprotei archaeon]|nr:MAG: hypothetical protein DRJ52_02140 [Thermoprotei archaeon]